jgi:hypothetical protein
VLFVALAVLESHRDVIVRYLAEVRLFFLSLCSNAHPFFAVRRDPEGSRSRAPRDVVADSFLQYCNDLSMTIELDTTLAQAEVLFLSFSQLVADIDRREAETKSASASALRRRKATLQGEENEFGAAAPAGEPLTRADEAAVVVSPAMPKISEDLRDLLKND